MAQSEQRPAQAGFHHIPVLLQQSIGYLNVRPGGRYVDATLGGGGHSRRILERCAPGGLVTGIDRDPQALAAAQRTLGSFAAGSAGGDDGRFRALLANFDELGPRLADQAGRIDGILFDLGVSSPQIDRPERGFSFQHDGPLDMRMEASPRKGASTLTAAAVINGYDLDRLTTVFREYGEEHAAARIARAIVKNRMLKPLETTAELAAVVRATRPAMPAKTLARIFQAVRIEVNDELGALRRALASTVPLLAPKGRIVVISYHSLEDRIVKEFFKQQATGCICPPDLPVCACGRSSGTLRILTGRPVTADQDEQRR
ncbi:MAG TPA: 16S rRNA (cytosine(1402)-N(4))-methyltransferase RsmH, partial [Candidatus Edwardsbacteria bacterium]|nr:16S rRNA (cytosine(1402)-N(4))-methyltransferase RsmH [Candidatus Edwardsbacteria bacterium]